MKKRYFLLAVSAIVLGLGAIQAKDASDIRVYIDPGHGGFGAGDRHMGTIKHGLSDAENKVYKDTTGFFESNTNLWKCMAIVDKLRSYGLRFDPEKGGRDLSNNIVMSRVRNVWQNGGPDINEIAREVYDNNFDFFMSLHSNAHVDGNNTNYPAFFIRGEGGKESVPGSREAAGKLWPYGYANTHMCWSNFSMTNGSFNYDIDFWGGDYATTTHSDGTVVKGYYAVCRHNTMGFLCEGYFHTYQPARHRAMNPDVSRHEGVCWARGIADVLGLQKESTGEIYGIVRDLHERFKHTYYNCSAASPDALMPLNNAKVELIKDGNVIATYTTDDEWNGCFIFNDLAEGDYFVKVSCEGYKEMDAQYAGPYTVKAHTGTYPRIYLESTSYVPPKVTYYNYPDELGGSSIRLADNYNFATEVADKEVPQLKGKAVKRVITRGNNVFVLAHDQAMLPTLVVLDAATLDVKTEISTEGCEGTESPLSDIQLTADGVLIGCANELNHITDDQVEAGETRGVLNIYKWTNDDNGMPAGDPAVWFTTRCTANFFKAYTGFTMAYKGTSDEGSLMLPSASFWYNKKVWLNVIDVVDGAKSSERFVNITRDLMNMDDLGNDYTITLSPVNENAFIVNSAKVQPMQFESTGYVLEASMPEGVMPKESAREAYFRYSGRSLMAVADVDGASNLGVKLYDITAGIDAPKQIGTANTALEALDGASAVSARTLVVRDENNTPVEGHIELFVIRGDGKATKLTTKGVDQPLVKGIYAYGLKAEPADDNVVLSFSLTDDAEASVELVPAEDNTDGEAAIVATGAFNKGENTVNVDTKTLSGKYNWNVKVKSPAVANVQTVMLSDVSSSGVVIDSNPESKFFGYAYVAGNAQRGIFMFNPALEQVNTEPYQSGTWDTSVGASPYRMGILPSGTVLSSDWGDKQGGIYKFDPANPDAAKECLFAGTIKPASGEWTYNGKVIGGSTSGLSVIGKGENTRLFTFQEDYPSDYKLTMVCYNIGNEEKITDVPEVVFDEVSKYMINGNTDVVAVDGKGFICGQLRYDPNNTKGVPVFLIADLEGKILFNSASIETLKGGLGTIGCSPDGSTFVYQNNNAVATVARLTWEPEFKLENLYSFNVLKAGGSNSNTYQFTFDPAGNLHMANRSSYRVFSLPCDSHEVVTPAAAEYAVTGKGQGIGNGAVDAADSNAPVELFNTQGVRVSSSNTAAGVYIRRQGDKVVKIVVK